MTAIDAAFIEFFLQGEIAWADEQTAVYLSNNANGDPMLVKLHRETGEFQTQPLEITGHPLSLSPDGSRLLIETSAETRVELSVMDLKKGRTDRLLEYNGSTPLSIAWTEDGSNEFRRLLTEPGTFDSGPGGYQLYATHQSRQVLYTQSSFQHSSEVYRLSLDDDSTQVLSQFNASAVAENQIRVDEVRFTLSKNVTRVGYLLQPAGSPSSPRNVPIVIHHQGGPGGAMTNRWGATSEDPFNLLPNFGISLLFMPFSGREGFGPDFHRALADQDNFGQIDVEESVLTARYLIEHGYTTEGQIGISGCSYGGYVTNQSITQYPGLFVAANSQCSIVDLAKWWEDNPYLVDFYEGALPTDRPDEYDRESRSIMLIKCRPLCCFSMAPTTFSLSSLCGSFETELP